MELIDDQGRLFGFVNFVDALAVLLVAAVVVAGIALVTQPGPAPDVETTYTTLDAGTLPAYVVSPIDAGDAYEPDDVSSLPVTDVHLAPANGGARVLLRVALDGEVNDESPNYDGAPPRPGCGPIAPDGTTGRGVHDSGLPAPDVPGHRSVPDGGASPGSTGSALPSSGG